MASVSLCPIYNASTILDNNGNILTGGFLYTYIAGSTSALQTTYQDSAGTTPNTNPIVVNSSGRLNSEIWIDTTKTYNFVLTLADGTSVLQSTDNVSTTGFVGGSGGGVVTSLIAGPGIGITGTGVVTISNTQTEWVDAPTTPTYISSTSFSVTGNQTVTYNPGRRFKALCTAGLVYGTIISSVSTTLTTVNVVCDGTSALDSGLVAAVSLGILNGTPTSAPAVFGTQPITLAAAATVNIGAAPTSTVVITGTTGNVVINAFDTVNAGVIRNVVISLAASTDTITLIYNATSMLLPGGVSLVLYNGDTLTMTSKGSGNWQCTSYQPASGYILQTPVTNLFPIGATSAGNAITLSLYPCSFYFRDTMAQGDVVFERTIGTVINLTVPYTATLGTVNNSTVRLVLVAIYYGGQVELAVTNMAGYGVFDETQLISTTTISASSSANNLFYSTTGRTSVPYKVLGVVDLQIATAGTWAYPPSLIQSSGGNTIVRSLPEVITSTAADTGTITRSHVGPVLIHYSAYCFTGGNNALNWDFYFDGAAVWSQHNSVNYQVMANPTHDVSFISNGSFSFRTLCYGDSGQYHSQFTITYL